MEDPFHGPDAGRWFALSATPLEPEHDGAVVWHTDITARKQAEIAWQASEQRLRTIVAHTPVLLWAVDAAGVFTLLEGPGLARAGICAGARVGASIWDMVRSLPALAADLHRAFAGEDV